MLTEGQKSQRREMDCRLLPSAHGGWPDAVSLADKALVMSFRRTIRVPEAEKTFELPPDLGPFPLYTVMQFEKTFPTRMSAKGGIFFPMHGM